MYRGRYNCNTDSICRIAGYKNFLHPVSFVPHYNALYFLCKLPFDILVI
ncbi:hypothetical protein HMPREF3033_01803 [Veillonellaceae bacterium DNF00751]|nr:hypothetical protein HMPREF3033_01803 [Veillonellaceae bacterium DNF00751]